MFALAGRQSRRIELTDLLRAGMWSEATSVIDAASPGDVIFRGDFYVDSPLLFGLGQYDRPIHLQLAMLILEKGSQEQFIEERQKLMEKFIRAYLATWSSNTRSSEEGVPISAPFVIGFEGETNMSQSEAKRQLLQFGRTLAGKIGWNSNEVAVNSSFTNVLGNPGGDIDILKLVCPAGHHLNDADSRGRTYLMLVGLCSNPQLHLLDCLWTLSPVPDIHARDNNNRTALWYAVWKGHPDLARYLCEKGAKGNVDGRVYGSRFRRPPIEINPLLAGVLHDSRHLPTSGIFDKVKVDGILHKTVSLAVDSGYLSDEDTLKHVQGLLKDKTNFPHLGDNMFLSNKLVTLMFGSHSAGLQQLCVRTIVNNVFFSRSPNGGSTCNLLSTSEGGGHSTARDCRTSMDIVAWQNSKASCISPEVVGDMIHALRLPTPLKVFFEVEMAKAQLCFHANQYGGMPQGRHIAMVLADD